MGKCEDCQFWKRQSALEASVTKGVDLGSCQKLSSEDPTESADYKTTGVWAFPVCMHDGAASTFETANWFGCIHFQLKD